METAIHRFHWLAKLHQRSEALFHFGLVCITLALVFLALSFLSTRQVGNVNAWAKPFKFALSIGIYAWTMAWYCGYLPRFNMGLFSFTVIALLGFEIVYITIQAARGQQSHFNLSSPFYAVMYTLMALAATIVALYTAYIGVLFCIQPFPQLPDAYLWAIRLGIALFVVFSLEGFVMGSRLSHTIGGPDGGPPSIPLLGWSLRHGDPRIPHFIGMHALQVLPWLAFHWLRDTRLVALCAGLYALLAVMTLAMALKGKPFPYINTSKHETITQGAASPESKVR